MNEIVHVDGIPDEPPSEVDALARENVLLRKLVVKLTQEIGDLDAIIPVDSPGRDGQHIIPGPTDNSNDDEALEHAVKL